MKKTKMKMKKMKMKKKKTKKMQAGIKIKETQIFPSAASFGYSINIHNNKRRWVSFLFGLNFASNLELDPQEAVTLTWSLTLKSRRQLACNIFGTFAPQHILGLFTTSLSQTACWTQNGSIHCQVFMAFKC